MITLAIDTSCETVSVALLSNYAVQAEVLSNTGLNHSITLLPIIKRIYKMAALSVAETDLFVCTLGPGSFTGLRIGLATTKGMAMAAGKPIIAVSTLEALAANIDCITTKICPIIDARKGHVYTAVYKLGQASVLQTVSDERLTDLNSFLYDLDGEFYFLGSGALKYADLIKTRLPGSFIAPIHNCYVRASVLGILGLKRFLDGNITNINSLTPRYLHLSAAEMNI